jgi:hypothetical protein
MSSTEILEQLKHLSDTDRLVVIETATRLIRENLLARTADAKADEDRRLQTAALAVKEFYEPGGALAEWTSLDAEEVFDDYGQGRGLAGKPGPNDR